MDKNIGISRKSVSISFREDILSEIDKWLAEKEKETGGKFTRSGFIEKAIIDKLAEYSIAQIK